MKYMRLGSKPDSFQTINNSNNNRVVSAGPSSDITIQVQDTVFHLHKYPLLSKCGRLLRLINNAATLVGGVICNDDGDGDGGVIYIEDMPGGIAAFELCMKFCYGITIILNADNIMSVRCAADYLEMTDKLEKGSLVFKLEVFLSSSIFKSWRDSIIALKTTKPLLPWSRDYKLVGRCIDSIASMVSTETSKINWSFTYTRRQPKHRGGLVKDCPQETSIPSDWWVEDVCDLDVALFYSVMMAIKSKGIVSSRWIGDALRVYAYKWLPGLSREYNNANALCKYANTNLEMHNQEKHKTVIETIVGLLPSDTRSCSCRFLLRLLRPAIVIGSERLKTELVRRISKQLHEASLDDILIPSLSYANDSLYDVDLIQSIVEQFLMQGHAQDQVRNFPNDGTLQNSQQIEEVVEDDSILKLTIEEHNCMKCRGSSPLATQLLHVAKLIDGYLAEIARDKNLPLSKFMNVAGIIPDFARPLHDGLYRAIDTYLKEHPNLPKTEKKKLCKLMDCKKLSRDACGHVAQNERLPLRVVVQVVFEQMRTDVANKPLQVKDILDTSAKTRTNSSRTR